MSAEFVFSFFVCWLGFSMSMPIASWLLFWTLIQKYMKLNWMSSMHILGIKYRYRHEYEQSAIINFEIDRWFCFRCHVRAEQYMSLKWKYTNIHSPLCRWKTEWICFFIFLHYLDFARRLRKTYMHQIQLTAHHILCFFCPIYSLVFFFFILSLLALFVMK